MEGMEMQARSRSGRKMTEEEKVDYPASARVRQQCESRKREWKEWKRNKQEWKRNDTRGERMDAGKQQ
ncbi:hypothetical protein Y032_0277g1116 [Ancylostoma ceylanicum]|uniref:Uncharacterized protein n=1 Tax=Ancylostoma ceylanicum TaxID=53326 RepID=A0A016S889_9BILA|nr:hypothetical protein Y032_0277g1116 [Ancylostoma ceylanicum]